MRDRKAHNAPQRYSPVDKAKYPLLYSAAYDANNVARSDNPTADQLGSALCLRSYPISPSWHRVRSSASEPIAVDPPCRDVSVGQIALQPAILRQFDPCT